MYSNNLVLQILDYIDNNLYIQISINDLENIFHYNKDYIMRLFKREINTTIIDYINRKKVYNSLFSYAYINSITSISLKYGFSSLEYYSEIFKKYVGVSPKKYYSYIIFGNNNSLEDINLIRDNIAILNLFFSKIEKYRKNIIPKDTVKSLSIFKK